MKNNHLWRKTMSALASAASFVCSISAVAKEVELAKAMSVKPAPAQIEVVQPAPLAAQA
jgi:hypothetical protein